MREHLYAARTHAVIDQVSGTLVKTPAAKKGCIGGRVIYIDRNQLIFHVAVPLARAPWPAARLMPMVLAAMVDTMGDFGLAARARAPSDIAVDDRKITGAAGRIGSMLRPRLARPDRTLRLLDVARHVLCGAMTAAAKAGPPSGPTRLGRPAS